MKARSLIYFIVGVVIASALAALAMWSFDKRAMSDRSGFAAQIDLSAFDKLAVQWDGRIKSYDSFAREMLAYVSGPQRILGQPPDFAYLDMMMRPEEYRDADIIYVKQKSMRMRLIEILRQQGTVDDARLKEIEKSGLVSPRIFDDPAVQEQMHTWSQDLVRTAKFVDKIETALDLRNAMALAGNLRLVAPPGDDSKRPWVSLNDLYPSDTDDPRTPIDETLVAASDQLTQGIDEIEGKRWLAQRDLVRQAWIALVTSWRGQDAAGVNRSIEQFAKLLPQVNSTLYPEQTQLRWESLYFKYHHFTWVWLVYLVSVLFLLMAVAYKWDAARQIGLGAFFVAFSLHTAALLLRWYVSGRWPNSNMFEAVTTSVWLGTVLGIGMELWARKTPLRGLFLLGCGAACMAAMMSAHYIPQLDASIRNMMPVLHDLWLYIHTNVIIASYALIAAASITALLYLVWRVVGGAPDYARAGGAAMIVDATDPTSAVSRRKVSAGEVLDGATMVLMELSFVMLWTGLVMGAIWADHSWGRPWGWDPKEVFALNTFLVFLVLVHVRLKTSDKGLWTAVLALIGCGVMLFNWIVINFIISGLHSYA